MGEKLAEILETKVIDISYEGTDIYTIKVGFPVGRIKVLPGQFFQIKTNLNFLRRPISVSNIGSNYISFSIKVVGKGTELLSMLKSGDDINIIGPLGNGYELDIDSKSPKTKYLLIGGGIGVAPLLPVADFLDENEYDYDFIVGHRSGAPLSHKATFICIENFESGDYYKGNISEPLRKHLEQNNYTDIFICGPEKMIVAASEICREHSYDPQILMEQRMACGVGACLVCTVERANGGFARVCKDGPMFRASEIKFENKNNYSAILSSPNNSLELLDMSVDLNGLNLKNPVTVASGTFGFGREYNEFFDISELGAISVKGLTMAPKDGNSGLRSVETHGGMINSVGLQNPGAKYFIENELPFLKEFDTKIIANINGNTVEEMCEIAEFIGRSNVHSLELNISCPNVKSGGMSFGTDPKVVREVVSSVRSSTEKHLIVKLSPNVTDIKEIAKICEQEGADALSLINTVAGMSIDVKTGQKYLLRGFGGLSGPSIKPIAIKAVYDVSGVVHIPIIGMGGISSTEDAIEFLLAGASAIAVGSAIFSEPLLPVKIIKGIREYMVSKKISSLNQITRVL